MTQAAILSDLRNALARITRQIVESNDSGEVTNTEIINRLKAEMPNEIAEAKDRLVDSALTKLLNEVGGRKKQSFLLSGQLDFFDQFPASHRMLPISKEVKKHALKMPIVRLEAWIVDHETKAARDRNKDLKDLVIEARKYAKSDDEIVEVALMRKLDVLAQVD